MDSGSIKLRKIIITAIVSSVSGVIIIPIIIKILASFNLFSLGVLILVLPLGVMWCVGAGFWNLFWIKDSLIGKIIYSLITIFVALGFIIFTFYLISFLHFDVLTNIFIF